MGVQYRGEPEFVIEGNPSGIRGRVASMKTCSESFDQVGESLGGAETEHWVGKAADRFRSRLEEEPRRWTGVADGFRSAAAALEGYAAALEAAQQAARVCKENYEEGKRVSATAKAEYDRDVSEGFQKKAAWEAQNGPGSYTLTITPFTDPGQVLRDRAVADFQAVIDGLEKTGSDTEQAVAQAHADADPTRQWPDKTGTASPAGSNASAAAPAGLTPEEADLEYGALSSKIAEEWKNLTPEERKRVLQAMLDEEFAKDGMKAPKISFESNEKLYGEWRQNDLFGHELMINQDLLKDPDEDNPYRARWAINTVAHEARHAEQHEIVDKVIPRSGEYLAGDREREVKRKYREDLLKQHNVTHEEAEAWSDDFNRERWNKFLGREDDHNTYYNSPTEKDARKAGRGFVMSMTLEDFHKYKRKAGVG